MERRFRCSDGGWFTKPCDPYVVRLVPHTSLLWHRLRHPHGTVLLCGLSRGVAISLNTTPTLRQRGNVGTQPVSPLFHYEIARGGYVSIASLNEQNTTTLVRNGCVHFSFGKAVDRCTVAKGPCRIRACTHSGSGCCDWSKLNSACAALVRSFLASGSSSLMLRP